MTSRLMAIGAMLALGALTIQADQRSLANGEWRFYSGDNGARKYSPLDQIRRDNVGQLRIAWRRPHLYQGKQYLVVAIGGFDHPGEFIALALP